MIAVNSFGFSCFVSYFLFTVCYSHYSKLGQAFRVKNSSTYVRGSYSHKWTHIEMVLLGDWLEKVVGFTIWYLEFSLTCSVLLANCGHGLSVTLLIKYSKYLLATPYQIVYYQLYIILYLVFPREYLGSPIISWFI